MMKPCTLCGAEKPLTDFYAAPNCKDGRANQCKSCVRARARIRHVEKADQIREYERKRAKLPHRVALRAATLERERRNKPERVSARNQVSNAVRDGKLKKMDCVFCGSTNTVAHHHDYTKPLDVTWLCTPCHMRFHALERMGRESQSYDY